MLVYLVFRLYLQFMLSSIEERSRVIFNKQFLWLANNFILSLMKNTQLNLRMFLTCLYLMLKNGFINTGYFGTPFYQNNILKDRDQIFPVIESLLMNIDKGIYHTP